MALRFQAATLVAAPSFPNALAWSQDNLIAIASGHLVTILNPALPFGPRGIVSLSSCDPYPIGLVNNEDLLSPCMLPIAISRDCHNQPCIRSISWSPLGMASNSGCLLAICTEQGRVKLYRPPFCDFSTEWIEVSDISSKLYDYLASSNFGDLEICSTEAFEQTTESGYLDDISNSVMENEHKRKRVSSRKITKTFKILEGQLSPGDFDVSTPSIEKDEQWMPEVCDKKKNKNLQNLISVSDSKVKPVKTTSDKFMLPVIPPHQYASRNAKLSSLVVAWSPMLGLSSRILPGGQAESSNCFSLLAIGGKSGQVSFWRVHAPERFSIDQGGTPPAVMFNGILQAHSSWITTISWALVDLDSSKHKILLATGSSDGSVKIWLDIGQALPMFSEVECVPFSLLKEVITVNIVPVSVLSLIVPKHSPTKAFLAIGKGSGCFELWACDILGKTIENYGSYAAHDHVITGLAWGFHGCCLYSCSQDNFVRNWVLHGSSLSEVDIPSSNPGPRCSTDLPDAFISCLGLAFSHGNLALAMVRSFDVSLLDKMYEGRSQKAAVEFLWVGGQKMNMPSNTSPGFDYEVFPSFSKNELMSWESNLLWCFKECENLDKPLVIWDLIAALLRFKYSAPDYVKHVIVRWLHGRFLKSRKNLSVEKILSCISKRFFKMSSRQLHLLNIITRQVVLSDETADKTMNFGESIIEDKQLTSWMKLLLGSERELRERLVGISFSMFLSSTATISDSMCWYPSGLAQIEQAVVLSRIDLVRDQLKVLATEVGKKRKSLHGGEYVEEEQCNYCDGSVPFDSPEVAFCQGSEIADGVAQSHKLQRCSVSMQVCPATGLWYCKCCHRWTYKLAPQTLFTMMGYPLDCKTLTEPSVQVFSRPFCPFCGILLQRLQPEFLLSPSPV